MYASTEVIFATRKLNLNSKPDRLMTKNTNLDSSNDWWNFFLTQTHTLTQKYQEWKGLPPLAQASVQHGF